ncbi:hypothetical protein Sste5346_009903 [Sporothrix stenoceras]|uniref:Metallo-beta-lactamase domain-containing protein n=1 Tax=Sporothrix stenoceras TaxID=5173 RepID=A0ABR3YKE6_9PEZI
MSLIDVDKIEITVLVDNELDPITPSMHPEVHYAGQMRGLNLTPITKDEHNHNHNHGDRGDAALELRMDSICCAAHGLSLLITATKGDEKHTLLFDAGPEGAVWERNVGRLQADVSGVEVIHLSHWHRDHSGGLEAAISKISAARAASQRREDKSETQNVVVDLHPDRPDFRGVQFPGRPPISLEADPTFAQLEAAGAVVEKHAEAHIVGGGFFWVSGEIPRLTEYEGGIRGAVRYTTATGQWTPDPLIKEERLVACRLKGKGLVVFTGCSHAGVVNACRHAVSQVAEDNALHAVVGGFHMADNDPTKMKATVADLKALSPTVILPGHCTGWRFKYDYEQAVPGSLVPCFVGTKYVLDSVTTQPPA